MTVSQTDRRVPLTLDTGDPYALPAEPSPQDGGLFLTRLVGDPAFINSWVLPLLGQARWAQDWYVAHRHGSPDGTISLQVFVWPAGSKTKIHDHSSWGVFCCAVGTVLEERYERLDDGSRPDHASLRMLWRRSWSEGASVSTVLPYGEGIHRVGNPTDVPAISVHLYGPRLGAIDGRDYDPSRDYVCDRPGD